MSNLIDDIEHSIHLVNKQIIGFIEHSCPEENLQGFHWPKTLINKGQVLSCPSPCTGMVYIFNLSIIHRNHLFS
jgi:hypothetical protein